MLKRCYISNNSKYDTLTNNKTDIPLSTVTVCHLLGETVDGFQQQH